MAQQLHDYLAGRRRLYGLTQDGIAKAVGVSRQTIASWEAGGTSPELFQVQKWIAALPLADGERIEALVLVLSAPTPADVASWQAPAEEEG